jgi:hypothetical protein
MSSIRFLCDIPNKNRLLEIDALLFAVYGWEPEKIRNLKLEDLKKEVEKALKNLTWGQAYKFNMLLEKKEVSLWKKLLGKKS